MKKAHRGKKYLVNNLSEALALNGMAQLEGAKKKTWHPNDLTTIRPKTENQLRAFEAFKSKEHVVLNGTAGTGKTFLSMYHALLGVFSKSHSKIVICRSAVPGRDQGFVPGTQDEKNALYEQPYIQICQELLRKEGSYNDLKKAGIIHFCTTGYLRGITMRDSIVISDETQNYNFEEINTLVTRLGDNSRLFISADCRQVDLRKEKSGYNKAIDLIKTIEDFGIVTFDRNDIVRSKLVKSWIIACEDYVKNQKPL